MNFDELYNEPLNRVLIIDKNSPLSIPSDKNYKIWMEMNLIIGIDYANNTFAVLKNRWGVISIKDIPLKLLTTFLFHPEITNLQTLEIEHGYQNMKSGYKL